MSQDKQTSRKIIFLFVDVVGPPSIKKTTRRIDSGSYMENVTRKRADL